MKMIKLTFAHNKHEFFVRSDQVRSVERHPENLLTSLVAMNLLTPTGPLVYEVVEGPDTVAQLVNENLP